MCELSPISDYHHAVGTLTSLLLDHHWSPHVAVKPTLKAHPRALFQGIYTEQLCQFQHMYRYGPFDQQFPQLETCTSTNNTFQVIDRQL